jgi:hypothetical protein
MVQRSGKRSKMKRKEGGEESAVEYCWRFIEIGTDR